MILADVFVQPPGPSDVLSGGTIWDLVIEVLFVVGIIAFVYWFGTTRIGRL